MRLEMIGLALGQYALDYDDTYPWDSNETEGYYRFFGKLYPVYEKGLPVFTCPASSDRPMELDPGHIDGSLFTENECRRGLSYAYGHNQGKPWRRRDPSTTRLAADKYATHDYTTEPYPKNRPLNHMRGPNSWGLMVRNVPEFGLRNCKSKDGGFRTTKEIGPLEADPETEFEKSGDPEHDQTGPDWWSDPPDK